MWQFNQGWEVQGLQQPVRTQAGGLGAVGPAALAAWVGG